MFKKSRFTRTNEEKEYCMYVCEERHHENLLSNFSFMKESKFTNSEAEERGIPQLRFRNLLL